MKKTFIGAVAVFAGIGITFMQNYLSVIGYGVILLGTFVLVKEYFSKD
ncbi:MAG: hypothetical protein PHY15_00680 [Eubacteriales bacterium]|nr:hypothetical protein [Eubacteriales bacterium]MDD4475296.1 hypothetical protein [Eubacteriales bacterium]